MDGDWRTHGGSGDSSQSDRDDLWKTPPGQVVWETTEEEGEHGLYCHMTFVRWTDPGSAAAADYESALVPKGSQAHGVVAMCAGRRAEGTAQVDPYHFGIMVLYTNLKARQNFNHHMSDTIATFLSIVEVSRAFDFYDLAGTPQPELA
jgi:hypothetical protein